MLITICDLCRCFARRELLKLIALQRCGCGELGPYNIFQFCVTLRYVLNFSLWKICIDEEKFIDCECHILHLKSFFVAMWCSGYHYCTTSFNKA